MKKNNNVVCPVCGKYTFFAHNNYDICKYCGWENEDRFDGGGANGLSLDDFRKRYQKTIKNNPCFIWRNDGYPDDKLY